MDLDLSLLASKLLRYREQFQTTLAEVSAATGIPESALVSFEQGKAEPSGDQILILADYYKCDFKFFISNEKVAPFEQTETLFRMHGDAFSRADRWAVQEFLFLCECEEYLLGVRPVVGRSAFTFRKSGTYYKGHGEEAAKALKRHLGYNPTEVGLDVFSDFRRIGLHVFRRTLENSDISGLFVRHPTAGRCLLVNYSEDIYRQRFTAAHEAGHALLDDDKDVVISFKQWREDQLSEIRANTFAARYLLPPESLRMLPDPRFWTPLEAVQWASKFKVSTAALANALKEEGLIDNTVENMIKAATVPAEMKSDPELSPGLSPGPRARKAELLRFGLAGFYVDLCFDAYEDGQVTAGRLAEMLLVAPSELDDLAKLYGRKLRHAG